MTDYTMSKYIDAEKLKERVTRLIASARQNDWPIAEDYLRRVIDIINSLQQEQPDNWDDEYREDELLTRFAFYTYKDEDSVLYLSNVFVEETSRNKGFGTKILQAAEKVAETIGAITIRLKAKRNSQANDWYRKHGYEYLTFDGEYDWLEKNLEYLKSKQEQPEEDLSEENITKEFHIINDRCFNEGIVGWQKEKLIARHFYELGLNARKEE